MGHQLKEVGFVHLHVHSSYSLLEGALKVGDIVKAAGADRQPALALTDTNNLFGALEFSEKASGSGIQPIAGMQLSVAFEAADPMARGGMAQIFAAGLALGWFRWASGSTTLTIVMHVLINFEAMLETTIKVELLS